MKKIIIISKGVSTGKKIYSQLKAIFSQEVEIENILVENLREKINEGDLILYAADFIKERYNTFVDSDIPYIVTNRIIDHKNIGEIIAIEEGTDVLLINDGYNTATEAIEQLLELGLNHIQYHPYYPDCSSYPKLKIAITPGERELAPYCPENIIDIGTRIVDITTIHEIGEILGLEHLINDSLLINYLRDIVEISKKIEISRRKSLEVQQILATIINTLDYGIALLDLERRVTDINPKLEYLLGLKRNSIIGRDVEEILGDRSIDLSDGKATIIKLESYRLNIDIREIRLSKKIGYILSVKPLLELDRRNEKELSIGKRNLYDFTDYYTKNSHVKELLEKAKKFSKTDATILIEGENGTGKEILAQAIHKNSYRNKNVFIPINMATISSNLVESELFGYEPGTFTGALKEGKIGLFERAQGGSLFIDEIGDTPIDVQAKLLRSLEEKRIRRIGSNYEISIDVRIIAATNKNLMELIREGKFRLDLFFRLNILPLKTIPLRMRKEDIEFLLKYFININLKGRTINKLNDFIQDDTIKFLNSYKWIGNVRELVNLVEYLCLIYSGKPLGISSLHPYMLEEEKRENKIFLKKEEVWVLEQFFIHGDIPLGRLRIYELAKEEGENIGEGRIRTILKNLLKNDLISSKGNRGSIITLKGRKILEGING